MAQAHWSDSDHRFMREALALAQAGIGLVSPNPAVGAVLVNKGTVVGRGTHVYEGRKHAEVLAIEDAGSDARGSTLYLNLEPCSHFGRTGPCADAVIAAGIVRVVCAMEDPNPAVSGQGFVRLRAAGVQVEVGLYEDEAQRLNEWFAKFVRTGLPFVTVKAGMSLDAKIAPAPGSQTRHWITSEAARQHAQQLRHAADAIVVGIGTVLSDNPLLTDRTGLPRRRPLLRVVLDSRLRTPVRSKLVQSANNDVLILCSPEANQEAAERLRAAGGEIIVADQNWHALLHILAERQTTSVLIEGGARVFASALNASLVDKVALYLAPKLLGSDALSAFGELASPIPQLQRFRAQRIEEDVLLTGYIRDPYQQNPL